MEFPDHAGKPTSEPAAGHCHADSQTVAGTWPSGNKSSSPLRWNDRSRSASPSLTVPVTAIPNCARLDTLLAAHEHPDAAADPADTASTRETARQTELDQELVDEAGCEVVYVAEQTESVRRRVALKVIKRGMDTKQVVARFDAERQALAMMDDPNIAKVLDAGMAAPWDRRHPCRRVARKTQTRRQGCRRSQAGPTSSWNRCAAFASQITATRTRFSAG